MKEVFELFFDKEYVDQFKDNLNMNGTSYKLAPAGKLAPASKS